MRSYSPIHVRDFLREIANPVLLNTTPGRSLETSAEFRSTCSRIEKLVEGCPCQAHRIPVLVQAALHFLRKAEQFDYFNLYGMPFISAFAGAVFGWNIRFLLTRNDFPQRRILILGETGSGKEQVARLAGEIIAGLNKASYMAINAANLSETLLEAELFGHEKGVYSGAHVARDGIIKKLDGGGALFLDEVSETPPSIQARLLRFLETGEYRSLGSRQIEHAHVSIIAASNRISLHDDPDFRADLLYRLSESVIRLPPLRHITVDPDQAVRVYDHLIISTARDMAVGIHPDETQAFLFWVSEWSKSVARRLAAVWCDRQWPGNIRECRNELRQMIMSMPDHPDRDFEAAMILRQSDNYLQSTVSPPINRTSEYISELPSQPLNLRSELESMERAYYRKAAQLKHSIGGVARFLGVTRQTASRRMRAFGIQLSADFPDSETE